MLHFFISFVIFAQVFHIFGSVPVSQQTQVSPIQADGYVRTPGIGSHKIHKQATTWNRARIICKEEGGYLAVINSRPELQAILNLYGSSKPHNGSTDSNHILLGFHDLFEEGHFVTVHDEPLTETGFNEWYDTEPNNAFGNEDCGALVFHGKLNDISCDKPFAFACEIPEVNEASSDSFSHNIHSINIRRIIEPQTMSPSFLTTFFLVIAKIFIIDASLIFPPQRTQEIRSDYRYTPGIGGHKIHDNVAKWRDAQTICEEEGGNLAIINSADEADVIRRLFRESPYHQGSTHSGYALIGFFRNTEGDNFLTIHGEPLENTGYFRWQPTEPNNLYGDEKCGSIGRDGLLNDISCEKKFGFVCELIDPNIPSVSLSNVA
ncbi:uncharacterized protein LOC105690000 [Athalia rosae]|uniref:uncharacterized protein LOC105690000 n=1 Tax=Athalia rosae TaxID=37344 RepID=UPI002033A9AC|nr:uncharacterized protein LOC105690000 [Athalia rosae]